MFNHLWQLQYPEEFRITAIPWPVDLLEPLQQAISLLESMVNNNSGQPAELNKKFKRLVAEVGTGLWRIRQKINVLEQNDASRETASAKRALDSTWNLLHQEGVEIQDHNGDIIIGGESLKILAFQPTEGIDRNRVIETLKPTIFYQDRIIQNGEVIVGKPATGSE